jgi:hypothetical protein
MHAYHEDCSHRRYLALQDHFVVAQSHTVQVKNDITNKKNKDKNRDQIRKIRKIRKERTDQPTQSHTTGISIVKVGGVSVKATCEAKAIYVAMPRRTRAGFPATTVKGGTS